MTVGWSVGAATVPAIGCAVPGDAAWTWTGAQGARAVVVDGTGHGDRAARACHTLQDSGVLDPDTELQELLRRMHTALASTIGAAAMVADVTDTPEGALLRFAGVGNVRLWSSISLRVPWEGRPGQLGHRFPRRVDVQEVYLQPGERVFLATDGVRSAVHGESRALPPGCASTAFAHALLHGNHNSRDDGTVVLLCPGPDV
jgi:hypothetical protein